MYQTIKSESPETVTLSDHGNTFNASELLNSSLTKFVSQQEIVSKLDEASYAFKQNRKHHCFVSLILLVLGVTSIASSWAFEPKIRCKSTKACKAYEKSQCTEDGKLVGCIISCCERDKIQDCTSNFSEYYKYSKMIQSSKTFVSNSSNGITTGSYCQCYEPLPNYNGPRDNPSKFCDGNLKIAGPIEKSGNFKLQESLIIIGISSLVLIFCASVYFVSCGYNLGRIFDSWEDEKGIRVKCSVESTGRNSNEVGWLVLVCPLCHAGILRFHLPNVQSNKL